MVSDEQRGLVERLEALLGEVPPERIEEMRALFLGRLKGWTRQARELEEIFDYQKNILRQRGYPKAVLDQIEPLRSVLRQLCGLKVRINSFLVAIPPPLMSLEEKMGRIDFNGRKGVCRLDSLWLRQTEPVELPGEPYLVANLRDGTVNRLPGKENNDLIADEGVMIVTFYPKLLRHCSLALRGSLSRVNEEPTLSLDDGRPTLENWVVSRAGSSSSWSPACADRWIRGAVSIGPHGMRGIPLGMWSDW